MLIRKYLWSQSAAMLFHSLCGKSHSGSLIVRHSTSNGIELPVSVIKWTCRDICGSHILADAWVSTPRFYQLISGSSSSGIIAIILHCKHQTIYFCGDSHWQFLLPAVIFFLHACLRNCRRECFILLAIDWIVSYETENKSFSDEDLVWKNKIISFLPGARRCWKSTKSKRLYSLILGFIFYSFINEGRWH